MTPKLKDKPAARMKPRCVALDSSGRRCKSTKTRVDSYHGDGEIYTEYLVELSEEKPPAWVFVRLCKRHHPHWEKMKGKRQVL